LIHSISQIFVQAHSSFSLFSQLYPSWSSWKHSLELLCSTLFWVVVLTSCFECVVTLVTDRLDSPFLCKGSSSTSVKTLFNISAQPQLLEVEGLGDVGIIKAELRYILCSCLIFFFLTFLWLLYSCENWIDLNCISLPLHLNIKSQIDLYISILGSLHSCTIFDLLIPPS
jgi:hypothetical protein